MLESLLIKLQAFIKFRYKETLTQVFSFEYCEIFKTTFFEELLRTAASEPFVRFLKSDLRLCVWCPPSYLRSYVKYCLQYNYLNMSFQQIEKGYLGKCWKQVGLILSLLRLPNNYFSSTEVINTNWLRKMFFVFFKKNDMRFQLCHWQFMIYCVKNYWQVHQNHANIITIVNNTFSLFKHY